MDSTLMLYMQIDLAIRFLNNPRVVSSPVEQKRAFLKKKGRHRPWHFLHRVWMMYVVCMYVLRLCVLITL